MEQNPDELATQQLSADKVALLRAYDRCCPDHQADLRYIANKLSSGCESHQGINNVIILANRRQSAASPPSK